MIKKSWRYIIIILIIIVIGTAVYFNFFKNKSQANEEAKQSRLLIEARKGKIVKTIAAEGYIEPINEKDLSFPSSATGSTKIKKIYIEEGELVKEGQLLIELDESEAELRYLQKENVYKLAKINGSDSEIREAKLDYKLASDDLENMDLYAPFDGIVTDIYFEEGNYYSNGDVATIKDVSRLQLEVNIEESNIPELSLGQKARIELACLPGKIINGEVIEIADEANNNNGTVSLPLTILLEDIDFDIKLGCSAEIDIITGEVNNKIVLPISAIFSKNGKEFVMKEIGDELKEVEVKTGMSNGLKIVVESGLNSGDKVLLNTYKQAPVSNAAMQNEMRPPGAGMGLKGGKQ